jgi:GTP pyrophosphokinase
LDDIEDLFGENSRMIIDGLTKIPEVFDENASVQAENFRKMILTISDDLRVVLIKLADRLHNMRTLESMRPDKQLKIASETKFLYAPLAHRLGLYSIKSELEDLAQNIAFILEGKIWFNGTLENLINLTGKKTLERSVASVMLGEAG